MPEVIVYGNTVLVDEDILPVMNQYHWRIHNGYILAWIKDKHVYLHRFVFGEEAVNLIDHINRNKLDNRRENLRCVSPRVNQLNSSRKVKGYIWRKQTNSWLVRFKINYRHVHYGHYKKEEDAKKRADEVRAQLLKEAGV